MERFAFWSVVVTSVVGLLASQGAVAQEELPKGTIQVAAGKGEWIDGPASLPPGTKMMLLEGHPGQKGMFTMRLKLAGGGRIQPHWHPADERVTILSGEARVGFGETFDESKMAVFKTGSFYLNPAKSNHYVWVVEDTEMQLTGMGPWELHPVGKGAEAHTCPMDVLAQR